jgi:hypothetical protein
MSADELIVVASAIAAIALVNWYFFFAERSRRQGQHDDSRRT